MATFETMSLAQWMHKAPDPLTKAIVQDVRYASAWLDQMNFATNPAFEAVTYRDTYEKELGWRSIGEDYDNIFFDNPQKIVSAVYGIGANIPIDTKLLEDKTTKLFDPKQRQITKAVRSAAKSFADKAINGDPTVDPKAPIGLKYIIDNMLPASQKILAATNGLDLDPTGATYSSAIKTFFRAMDKLYWAVDGGATHILVDEDFARLYEAIARDSNYLKTTEDSLHRTFQMYKDAKIIPVGRLNLESGVKMILPNYETVAGAVGTEGTDHYSSVIAVRMDTEHLMPWQMKPLKAVDEGKVPAHQYHNINVDWNVGIHITSERSVARLYGLKME